MPYTIPASENAKELRHRKIEKTSERTEHLTIAELEERRTVALNALNRITTDHNRIVDELQAIVDETRVDYDVPVKVSITNQ